MSSENTKRSREENAAAVRSAVIHWEQNALKILRSNTIQWQSEIIGCNTVNIFQHRIETQDISPLLQGCPFVCETHSRVTDIWCLPSIWNFASNCLNKRPHFCLVGQSSGRQSALIDFFVSQFLSWLRLESAPSESWSLEILSLSWHVIWHLHVMRDTVSWHFMTCNQLIRFTLPALNYPRNISAHSSAFGQEIWASPVDQFSDPSPDMWHFYR